MIISFTASNFKSIKEETTLFLGVENQDGVHSNNIAYVANNKLPILRSAGIWGANASGKSNIIDGIGALQNFVVFSYQNELDGEIKEYNPFKLDNEYAKSSIFFEIDFVTSEDEHYIYSVEFLQYEVVKESLEFFTSAKSSNLFKRDKAEIKFGTKLSGLKAISCRNNQSYLSVAAQNENSSEQIKNVYRFIRDDIAFLESSLEFASSSLAEKRYLNALNYLLACADTGISKVDAEEKLIDINSLPKNMPENVKKYVLERVNFEPKFFHNNSDIEFSRYDESDGTLHLYALAPMLIYGTNSSMTWIIDELESRLHPKIAELIIHIFHDSMLNGRNPQLIFSTHNTALMDSDMLRRDQIWFTQKDNKGVTNLECLDEYKDVRADTNFEKWYRNERFDGVPNIKYNQLREMLINLHKEVNHG